MEERRLLLAVALSLLVLTAYQLLFPPAPRPKPTASPTPPSSSVPAAATPRRAGAARAPARCPCASRASPTASSGASRSRARTSPFALTNRGGRLLAWRLLAYKDARGRPEDMVQAATGGARPLDLETGDPDVDARLRDALFVASSERLDLAVGRERRLRLEFADGDLAAEKTLEFRAPRYLIAVEAHVRRAGAPLPVRIAWGPGIGNPSAAERELRGYVGPQAVAYLRGALVHTPVAKLETARA
jgi:YidC/Oxa1 family membrane protein insertase